MIGSTRAATQVSAVVALGAALLLPGCAPREGSAPATGTPSAEVAATEAPSLPPGASRIGEAITVTTAPVQLAAVRANPSAYFDKTLLVEGTAAAVCQAKGCWMTITDGQGEPIWVRWSSGCGGAYAFPKDAAGRRVILQGSFYAKEISPADAEHLAGESGGMAAAEIAGPTFEINATACVLLPEGPAPAPATRAG
jgi:hypothetical protein